MNSFSEKSCLLRQTGWLRFTHPLLQTCQISALNLSVGSGFRGPRKKKSSKFVHQLSTFEMNLRYWHENNLLHAPYKFNSTPVSTSLLCNSAGTRPTQHLPLLCWKKRFAETKNCKSVLPALTCSCRENCSYK